MRWNLSFGLSLKNKGYAIQFRSEVFRFKHSHLLATAHVPNPTHLCVYVCLQPSNLHFEKQNCYGRSYNACMCFRISISIHTQKSIMFLQVQSDRMLQFLFSIAYLLFKLLFYFSNWIWQLNINENITHNLYVVK